MRTRQIRHKKIRAKIFGTSERPRLGVFRSSQQIYAYLIDDNQGKTLVSASSLEFEKNGLTKLLVAKKVGKTLAEKAKNKKITRVVFDRSGYLYHGRVEALAQGSREGGLKF